MNQLQAQTKQTPIEIALGIDENRTTTARKLYEFFEMDKSNFSKWCKRNITENEFAEENQDYVRIVLHDETPTGGKITREDYKLTASFAKKLSMTAKNEKGEQARNYFVGVEDSAKEMAMRIRDMSPQLQFMISIEMEQKRQARELLEAKEQGRKALEKVENIKDVISLDTTSWREDTGNLLRKISIELGGGQAYSQVRSESYELLNKRMGVDLKARLTNKRRRMADEGVCKSRRDKFTYVDVIADDKKLIEGYTAIVKEMAIKYGVA